MCAPIGLIAGIASAGASFIGQRQAASAQERAQARATELEQARLRDQLGSARLQQAQANIASAQRIRSASLQAEQARSRATVAAGEAGVTGLSVNALVDDMTRREAQFRFYENQRQDMSNTNLALSMEDARMRSRMNLLGINQPIQQENPLQALLTGLQVGTSMQSVAQDWGSRGVDVSNAARAEVVVDGAPRAIPVRENSFSSVTPPLPENNFVEFVGPPDLRGNIGQIPFVGPPDLRGLGNTTIGNIDPIGPFSILPPL
tara:strand:+ start:494 stop:1276 length:783 start_codon:yes stop_codon:yes gene_type:complete